MPMARLWYYEKALIPLGKESLSFLSGTPLCVWHHTGKPLRTWMVSHSCLCYQQLEQRQSPGTRKVPAWRAREDFPEEVTLWLGSAGWIETQQSTGLGYLCPHSVIFDTQISWSKLHLSRQGFFSFPCGPSNLQVKLIFELRNKFSLPVDGFISKP